MTTYFTRRTSACSDLERLTHIGSDHFPIYIRLSYEPQGWLARGSRELECRRRRGPPRSPR
ncbi:MAG: hypothetical protein WKG07_01000 [Hymenobacter sp.]